MTSLICWLERWQDLIAGLVGATAVIATVRWTLLAERRRREEEAKALRTALGAEVRQFGNRALDGYTKLVKLLSAKINLAGEGPVSISTRQLENLAHFPTAVVYPNTAGDLGVLEDHAHGIVFFYGQITLVEDALSRLPADAPTLPLGQVITFGFALFQTAEAAVEALPAFESQRWADGDRKFVAQVAEARKTMAWLESLVPVPPRT